MARSLSRRGRMKSEDERRIQINSLFIEHEVEAKDLAAVLYSSQIIDSNDRDEILGGSTRLERTRRMIDILLLRGPDAFDVFLHSLDESGYDHVASRLRTTEVMLTPKPSFNDLDTVLRNCASFGDLDPIIREASALSLSSRDPGLISERLKTFEATCLSLPAQDSGGLSERLKKIEDLWDILSRRVTRIEQRVEPTPSEDGAAEEEGGTTPSDLGKEELQNIKMELAELKTDTMAQVQELTSSNTQKAAMIENLLGEVEEKTAQLQEAHCRIEELEQRIELLEAEKTKSIQEVGDMRDELAQHREHVKHQEEWFNAENLRMKNKLLQQEKALSQQESRVTDLQKEEQRMRQVMEAQQEDLKEQRRLMEEQSYQLGLLTKHMMTIANNNNNASTTKGSSNNNSSNNNNHVDRPRRDSSSSDSDDIFVDGHDVKGDDVRSVVTVAVPPTSEQMSNVNVSKPHTAQPAGKMNVVNKNQYSNYYHRTSFNIANSGSVNNGGTVGGGSKAVCLHMPANVQQTHPYRAIKRSAPAPNFRVYQRKK